MRIKIDISAQDLRRVQRVTGLKKKSLAVKHAPVEYLKSREKAKFIGRALGGKTNFSRSNDELEELLCHR